MPRVAVIIGTAFLVEIDERVKIPASDKALDIARGVTEFCRVQRLSVLPQRKGLFKGLNGWGYIDNLNESRDGACGFIVVVKDLHDDDVLTFGRPTDGDHGFRSFCGLKPTGIGL